MDETRIDAAPTPAHVFAYRAFRSVFVHSAESSPIRPQQTLHHSMDDKENANCSPTRGSRFATSPVKIKRKDGESTIPELVISLTPKRQRTIPVSPTKSILKNPHAPTPRRAELRDVTVTFKNLRKSMSPELARLPSPRKAIVHPQFDIGKLQKLEKEVAPAKKVATKKMIKSGASALNGNLAFDLEAYKAQTEKEIRRLLKYSQKWKEQAKRQDTENLRLRALLEEAGKENERLQTRLERQLSNRPIVEAPALQTSNQRSRLKHTASLQERADQLLDIQLESKREESKFQLDTTVALEAKTAEAYGPPVPRHVQSTSNALVADAKQVQPGDQKDHTSRDEPSARAKNPTRVDVPVSAFDNNATESAERSITLTQRDGVSRFQVRDVPVPIVRQPSELTQLPEDRKAAAKARLAARRQARIASAPLPSVSIASPRAKTEPSKSGADESGIDWLAAA